MRNRESCVTAKEELGNTKVSITTDTVVIRLFTTHILITYTEF